MSSHPDDPDHGLLAPTWAGTAAARATSDHAYLAAMLEAETALARAEAAVGVVPKEAAAAIGSCARVERFDLPDLVAKAREGGNPVIPLVDQLRAVVREADPDAARWVHHGATSQDILDTATMLVAARTADLVLGDLDRACAAAARLATEHRSTAMAGRTLTQHAVPTTFGLKAAGWLTGLLDAADRLRAIRVSLPAQLGGAAGTLAALGDHGQVVLAGFAAETGLAEPTVPWHTIRTPISDLAAALAHASGSLGKVAADVALLAQTEVAEVAEPTGGPSSAMPHKQNPARSVLMSAAARQVPALTSVLHQALVAEHERPAGAWHAEWQPLREALRLVGGAAGLAAELLEGLRVDAVAMRANLRRTGDLLDESGEPNVGSAEALVERALARFRRTGKETG